MELALISRFTWTDGFALVTALLGTILYAVEFYVLAIKRNAFSKDRVVLFTSLTFLLYFAGNFLGLFARALAQDFFQTTYTVGWIINLFGLSFMPALLVHAYAEYYSYKTWDENRFHFRFLPMHVISVYFFYQFVHDISNQTPLPWPVLTSSIKPFQFKLFAWWLGLCTGAAGIFCYLLKGNPRWKRFDSYFPINGIYIFTVNKCPTFKLKFFCYCFIVSSHIPRLLFMKLILLIILL